MISRSRAPPPSTFGDAFSGPKLSEEEKEAKERKAQAMKEEELGTSFIIFFIFTKTKKLVLLQ